MGSCVLLKKREVWEVLKKKKEVLRLEKKLGNAFPMCQIRAPAGINLTPSQHKKENMPVAMLVLLQASAVENRSSLGPASPVANPSQHARAGRYNLPTRSSWSKSSSKGDPKCGLELRTLAVRPCLLGNLRRHLVPKCCSPKGYPHRSRKPCSVDCTHSVRS